MITNKLNTKLTIALSVLIFVPILLKIISIHPNENVYFNNLIGGLSGAKNNDIKYWGFSFGSPYRQAAKWLNENAPEGAKIAYTYDLIPNLPRIWLRQDLNLYNGHRSGYLQQGEYAIGLTYDGTAERSYYDSFLENFVDPVYEVKVDGVAILRIWKNDKEYLKPSFKEAYLSGTTYKRDKNNLIFDLNSIQKITKLEVNYSESRCKPLSLGAVYVSKDSNVWELVGGYLPDDWRVASNGEQPKDGKFVEPFVGQEARYIKLNLTPDDTCLLNLRSYKVFTLK